ncbi:MAG: hypothetical protein IAE95_02685 [Chitinophagaceae bacterium]|nr:hypothetical protein [Chitinophagaceae bacterium]
MKLSLSVQKVLLPAIVAVITLICFRYTLYNQFTNWDDDFYVTNDVYIREFSAHNLRVLFTEDITRNNYHPLCMLSLAVNYFFSGLEPMGYYLTNILIHAVNAWLVFVLFFRLALRLSLSESAALFLSFFGSLWFAIHPMHVESVAWISERKDVLYAAFYISGLLSYLRYLDNRSKKWLWITYALFVLSCLSKPMAVTFPLALLALDYLMHGRVGLSDMRSKTFFLLTSFAFGAAAFYTQHRTGAVASFGVLSISERIMYAGYGFIMYVAKFFVPVGLSTFYPYPYRFIDGSLPMIYYLAPFLSVLIVVLPVVVLVRLKSRYVPVVVFGLVFFVVNLVLVLQFISVGSAIMADRYSYVAYIGLLFTVFYLLADLIQRMPSMRLVVTSLLLVVSAGYAIACAARTKVWHNSETLHTDAIEKYPMRALLSYKWRGHHYFSIGEYEQAMQDYEVLVTLRSADNKVKANMEKIAVLSALKNNLAGGQLKSVAGSYKSHLDSAIAFVVSGDTTAAFRQYVLALAADPVNAERALATVSDELVQKQQYARAIAQYNMLMKLNTTNPFYYFLRGCAHFGIGHLPDAVDDWEVAVKMNSKDVQQSASYNLSVAYDSLRDPSRALFYMEKAQKLGYNVASDYAARIRRKAGK